MSWWERLIIIAAVLLVAALLAGLVERRMSKYELDPVTVTRYRVLRRTIMAMIMAVALLSALLIIPEVRAVAAGILASSAVIGVVLGFAAQRTLGNAIAGLLIAFSQPLRIGDRVTIDGESGTVEEIHLTYTFIRTEDNARLVIPNETLASDTIRNATIVDRKQLAEVSFQVPLNQDLEHLLSLLRAQEEGWSVVQEVSLVGADASSAIICLRAPSADDAEAERVEEELRLRGHRILREAGVYA
jgi:small-conductance mechanosensitive channel